MLGGARGRRAIARAAQIAAFASSAMMALCAIVPAAEPQRARRHRRGRWHDRGRSRPRLSKQSPAQCSALCHSRHRRKRSNRARRLSPTHQRHVQPDRAVPGYSDEGGNHRRGSRRLQPEPRRHCGVFVRVDHHPNAVQRFPNRQSHPSGRRTGILRSRGAADHGAEHPAQRRHRLHESLADGSDPRASAQQRERTRGDVAANPRPVHRRRSHAHRRRAGGIASGGRPVAAVAGRIRTTSPRRRSISR